jgi:hypothetical protein
VVWRWDRRCEAFTAEEPRLLALPDNPYPLIERVSVEAGKSPYVRFDLNDHSMARAKMQRLLTALADPNEVRIVDGAEVLACHRRSYDKGGGGRDRRCRGSRARTPSLVVRVGNFSRVPRP